MATIPYYDQTVNLYAITLLQKLECEMAVRNNYGPLKYAIKKVYGLAVQEIYSTLHSSSVWFAYFTNLNVEHQFLSIWAGQCVHK